MSRQWSPLFSWVTLLLFLSSVTGQASRTQHPESPRNTLRGISAINQTESQGAPLSSGNEFNSTREKGPNGVSVSPENQRVAGENVPTEREGASGERVANERASSEKVSETASSASVPNRREAIARITGKKPISKRATHERAFTEKASRVKEVTEKTISHEDGALCAYRVAEDGEAGRLCFRHTQVDFTCPSSTCRQVRSPGGNLVANMLSNGSVLLQWTYDGWGRSNIPGIKGEPSEAPGFTVTPTAGGDGETDSPKSPNRGQQTPQRGFRMSCWWNGSYTQFECAGVILGNSCRDFLLTELHENVPYRICLQPLWAVLDGAESGKRHKDKMKTIWDGASCMDFSVSPSGMQDIVIAMTTVGGAICVMLVIICLLVAYITENIMSPSVQHTLTARHSTRSHNTHL